MGGIAVIQVGRMRSVVVESGLHVLCWGVGAPAVFGWSAYAPRRDVLTHRLFAPRGAATAAAGSDASRSIAGDEGLRFPPLRRAGTRDITRDSRRR